MNAETLKFWKYSPTDKPQFKGRFCHVPFDMLQIDSDGDVQLCSCQIHMPYTIGNIYKTSLNEIWSSELANNVRQSVIDGNFTYCNYACPQLNRLSPLPDLLPTVQDFPGTIKIDLDRSCNLKCPSCREHPIMEKNKQKIDQQITLFEEIKSWATKNPHRTICVIPMASGEVFASHSGLKFLKSLENYPAHNLQLQITTNGTLITRNKDLLLGIKHLLKGFSISLDAATPETYAQVRGGDWNELMLGLTFLHNTMNLPLQFNFCIQKNNWHEIEQFADLAEKFDARIMYQKLLDWGHWTIKWWHNNNVFDRKLSCFDKAIKKLHAVSQKYPGKIGMAAELQRYLEKTQT